MKKYRIYFNRKVEAPQVWSVDEGDQSSEINVQWVEFQNCSVGSFYDNLVGVNPDTPCAWFQVYAVAEFTRGGVIFHGAPDDCPSPRTPIGSVDIEGQGVYIHGSVTTCPLDPYPEYEAL